MPLSVGYFLQHAQCCSFLQFDFEVFSRSIHVNIPNRRQFSITKKESAEGAKMSIADSRMRLEDKEKNKGLVLSLNE